jgi:TolA-binding protein
MERLEAVQEKEKGRIEEAEKKIREKIEKIKEDEGKLQAARKKAWTGYVLSMEDGEGMTDPLVQAIEYAEAILDLDEKLQEDFKGDFRLLEQKRQQLQKLVDRIEELNFEASEIDQSAIEEEEGKEFEPDDVLEEMRNLGDGDQSKTDINLLVGELMERFDVEEETIEAAIEKKKSQGVLYEPAPSVLAIL